MQQQSTFSLKGAVQIVLKRADGTVETRYRNNLIVDVGFDFIADAVGKSASRPNVMSHIAVGTGSTAVAAGQTALVAEAGRKAATYSHTAGTKTFTFSATFNPGEATGALTEAGVFNAASGGVMLDRVVFPVINKGAGDTITATFVFTLSQPS